MLIFSISFSISIVIFFKMYQEEMVHWNPTAEIDNKVTILGKIIDFYIVSRQNQEVVSPTGYRIIKDSTTFSKEFHQKLAFTSFHHNSSLSVPALLHYSKKLIILLTKLI